MLDQVICDETTAPEAARPALAEAKRRFGFIPNLTAGMAVAPPVLEGYLGLGKAFGETTLSPIEREVVTLTVATFHGCVYCTAGHSMLASMVGMEAADLEALRSGGELSQPRLEALRVFTRQLLEARGKVAPAAVQAFIDAGFRREQVLEVVLGIAFKTLSNYTNHINPVPLDEQMAAYRWTVLPSTETTVLVSGWLRSGEAEALASYQAGAGPIMARHGGKPSLKARPELSLVGALPDLVVLVRFPSSEAARAAFEDPDYLKLVPLRDRAFSRLEVSDLGAA